jgi:hypothetical protein
MVENPNPPTPSAQEFSKFSAESAPFVYFDGVMTAGVHQAVIQLELAASTLVPTPDGKTTAVHVITGHLRCSPAAAVGLRKAIDSALLYLRQRRASRASGRSFSWAPCYAIMNEPHAPYAARVAAAEALLDRGWGKPKQSHEAEISHRYVIEVPALSMSSAEWQAEALEPPGNIQ